MSAARRLAPLGAVLAIVLVTCGAVAYGAAVVTAAPVPSCVKPTSNVTAQKQVDYAACLQARTEALLANSHPVPTVTETATVTATATVTQTVTASPTPTTEPSPTPTPTPTPAPTTGYPNASTTGVPAGTTLTAYTGPSRITTAGTVVTGKTLGCVEVAAGGVVIRNSRITCAAGIAVTINDRGFTGTPALLEDVEITCQNTNGTAVSEAHFVLRRVNIHSCENGVDANQDITVEDSYLHDLYNGGEAHMDGIQLAWHWDGSAFVCCAKDITIRHNTIYGVDSAGAFGTSAIISNPGADENVLIQNNLMAGGAATIYCNRPGKGVNVRLLDNRFSTRFGPKVGAYMPSTECGDETQSGNVIHETGAQLTLD